MKFSLSLLLTATIIITSLLSPLSINAQETAVNSTNQNNQKIVINFFNSATCPHCKAESTFLEYLKNKYPSVQVHSFEITQNPDNAELMKVAAKKIGVEVGGVPFTIIGDQHMLGYGDDQTHGAYLEYLINQCQESKKCDDILADKKSHAATDKIVTPAPAEVSPRQPTPEPEIQQEIVTEVDQKVEQPATPLPDISLPFFGKLDPTALSLPLLTIVIGLLDGFNPCAMWALIFLISLLLNMKNKTRRWILGSAFILTSGIVYLLFMTAWLNFFLFVGYIIWIRLAIGVLAIGAGIYNLRDFLINKDGSCSTEGGEKKKSFINKLSRATHNPNLVIALISIMLLASGVNLIELFCSAGFPAIYIQVLSLAQLNYWQYYGYLALYIFMFILDDLIVFFTAMITLQMTGLDTKYARYSRLFGGVLILLIGLALLFKPELLMFG